MHALAHRGPLVVDVSGPELEHEDKELLAHPAVAGVILFARNTLDAVQTSTLCKSIKSIDKNLLIVIDQEGGRVQRLTSGVVKLPSLALLGELYQSDQAFALSRAEDLGWLMAAEVRSVGVDLSLAPVLDIDDNRCPAINNRSFSPNPTIATALARSYIDGMRSAGMQATAKHFPGHGQVILDSHIAKPIDSRSLDEIERSDLQPFLTLIKESRLSAVMPAHITFTDVDDKPVGFSHYWLQNLLRNKYQFPGLIFSDDLNMDGADISGGYKARASAALQAGCDLLFLCNNRPAVKDVVDELPHTMNSELAAHNKSLLLQEHVFEFSQESQQRRDKISSWLSSVDC
jgi:beta-N-acetylhexosaminidase